MKTRNWLHALRASRLHALLIGIVFYLLGSGQGNELTASLATASAADDWLVYFCLLAWTAQTWLWSAVAIDCQLNAFGKAQPSVQSRLLPAGYAGAIALIALIQFLKQENLALSPLVGLSCFALFFSTAFIVEFKAGGVARSEPAEAKTSFLHGMMRVPAEGAALRGRSIMILASFLWASVVLVAGLLVPTTMADTFGSFGVIYLGLSALTPLLSVLSIRFRYSWCPILSVCVLAPFVLPNVYTFAVESPQWSVPLIALASIAALTAARTRFNIAFVAFLIVLLGASVFTGSANFDAPHTVRSLALPESSKRCEEPIKTLSCNKPVASFVDEWRSVNGVQGSNYVVFVSAAGGGIRAAYWTAILLAHLTECIPNFDKKIFSISGVSGGSLGAAAYVSVRRDAYERRDLAFAQECKQHPFDATTAGMQRGLLHRRVGELLASDLLSPVVAHLLFRDLFQSLLPVPIFADRSVALELAFEKSWEAACATFVCAATNPFASSFLKLRDNVDWLPVLFLNGTHMETGRRIITSQALIDRESFVDAYDYAFLTQRDLTLATAVLNSARFPYVSPAGVIRRPDVSSERSHLGHVLDGGFFENNGDVTSQEVMRAVLSSLKKREATWKPFVIEIINDVDAGAESLFDFRDGSFGPTPAGPLAGAPRETGLASQLFGPARGLYATRSARGVLASKQLADTVSQHGGEFLQLRLCPQMEFSPPLGWLLTNESRQAMDELVLGHAVATAQRRFAASRGTKAYEECFKELQARIEKTIRLLR